MKFLAILFLFITTFTSAQNCGALALEDMEKLGVTDKDSIMNAAAALGFKHIKHDYFLPKGMDSTYAGRNIEIYEKCYTNADSTITGTQKLTLNIYRNYLGFTVYYLPDRDVYNSYKKAITAKAKYNGKERAYSDKNFTYQLHQQKNNATGKTDYFIGVYSNNQFK